MKTTFSNLYGERYEIGDSVVDLDAHALSCGVRRHG